MARGSTLQDTFVGRIKFTHNDKHNLIPALLFNGKRITLESDKHDTTSTSSHYCILGQKGSDTLYMLITDADNLSIRKLSKDSRLPEGLTLNAHDKYRFYKLSKKKLPYDSDENGRPLGQKFGWEIEQQKLAVDDVIPHNTIIIRINPEEGLIGKPEEETWTSRDNAIMLPTISVNNDLLQKSAIRLPIAAMNQNAYHGKPKTELQLRDNTVAQQPVN